MTIAIRYYTQTGNAKKLADAIAEELGIEAKSTDCPLDEKVDILFLCNSVYWGGIDTKVKNFINKNASNIGALVDVSTAAFTESSYKQMQKLTAQVGVKLCDKEFHCRGKFAAFHKDRPNNEDLQNVKTFAKSLLK